MRYWLAAAVMMAAAPASAQVTLEANQATSIKLTANGGAIVAAPRPAELGEHDRSFVEEMRDSVANSDNIVMGSAAPGIDPPPVALGQIEIIFVVLDGKETVLVMVNGYDQAVTYRARIWAEGRDAPTDVCLLLPGKRGYEQWPFAIDRIELSAFRTEPWKDGDPIPCR